MQKVERKHFNNWQLHFRTITADDSFAIAVAQRYATVLAVDGFVACTESSHSHCRRRHRHWVDNSRSMAKRCAHC